MILTCATYKPDVQSVSRGPLLLHLQKGQTVELQAEEIEVYGWADPCVYPLQKTSLLSF